MMRGSGGLHRRSLRELGPVVQAIADEPPESWDLDVPRYSEDGIGAVLAISNRIENAYTVSAGPVLVSKTILGVFGCVPAFDRFFRAGFGGAKLNRERFRPSAGEAAEAIRGAIALVDGTLWPCWS